MELGLERPVCPRPLYRRGRRMTRSRWWFAQMRQVVDRARAWDSIPTVEAQDLSVQHERSPK